MLNPSVHSVKPDLCSNKRDFVTLTEPKLTILVLSLQQIAPGKQTLCPEDLCNILYFFTLPDFICAASYISDSRPLNGYQGCLYSQYAQCTFYRPCLILRVLSHCKFWWNNRQPLLFSIGNIAVNILWFGWICRMLKSMHEAHKKSMHLFKGVLWHC